MRFAKVSWEKLYKDSLRLSEKIKDLDLDKIVAIARGGLVVARVVSDMCSLPISNIVISSYRDLQQLGEPEIVETPASNYRDENILIIDEVSDTGKTFERAVSFIKHFPVRRVYTASLYVKPQTKFFPDFWVEEIDAWIVFPYDLRETYESLLKKFRSSAEVFEKMREIGFSEWEIEFLKKNQSE